jgi:hypothetical protein
MIRDRGELLQCRFEIVRNLPGNNFRPWRSLPAIRPSTVKFSLPNTAFGSLGSWLCELQDVLLG